MIGTRIPLRNTGQVMRTVIQLIRLVSPSRSLFLFVLFCVFCLSSCAVGDDLDAIADAAVRADRAQDGKADVNKGAPMFDQLPRYDASTNLIDTASVSDASLSTNRRDASTASDTGLSQIPRDAAADTELSFPAPRDVTSAPDVVVAEDVSASPPADATPSFPDVMTLPDVGIMETPDIMSMPIECHVLIVRLNASTMPRCTTGWSSILYDFDGHPHESAPGGVLTYQICGRLQGQLVLSAHCAGTYLLDWPGSRGVPANRGGVASITLDGNELADAEALLCLDRWSRTPGIRPVIPLEPYFYGRCP